MNSSQIGDNDGKRTVLIVDDNEMVRASLREWLSAAFPECSFLEAKSGEEAVAQARARPLDILLMDIGLPGINGIQATRRIKETVPQVLVVMLTIYEASAYRADAEAAGASAYVPKRKMYTDLIPILAALLDRSGIQHSEAQP